MNKILMIIMLKTVYFQNRVLYKSDLHISSMEDIIMESSEKKFVSNLELSSTKIKRVDLLDNTTLGS